jgi:hypothetical protein
MTFVFKYSKFFVFYGNSTDSAGNSIFNYRTVDGVGMRSTGGVSIQTAVAREDGVYFISPKGVYRTTGGPPTKVSGALNPLFQSPAGSFFTHASSIPLGGGVHGAAEWGNRILFSIGATDGVSGTEMVLAYYPDADDWSVWKFPAGWYVVGSHSSGLGTDANDPSLLLRAVGGPGLGQVQQTSSAVTADAGTAIVSRYRSGFYSPIGSPSQECTIRESILEGIGTPSYSVSRDFGSVPTSGGGAKTAVTLGTSPAYAQGRHRVSQRGRRFSWQAEATSGAWRINQVVQHVTGVRSPGLKTAA